MIALAIKLPPVKENLILASAGSKKSELLQRTSFFVNGVDPGISDP